MMFLLQYDYKYGTDTYVCQDKETAKKISFGLMCQWLDDELSMADGNTQLQIANAIKNGDWETAASLWHDYTDETHSISEEMVIDPKDISDYTELLERIFSELEE